MYVHEMIRRREKFIHGIYFSHVGQQYRCLSWADGHIGMQSRSHDLAVLCAVWRVFRASDRSHVAFCSKYLNNCFVCCSKNEARVRFLSPFHRKKNCLQPFFMTTIAIPELIYSNSSTPDISSSGMKNDSSVYFYGSHSRAPHATPPKIFIFIFALTRN